MQAAISKFSHWKLQYVDPEAHHVRLSSQNSQVAINIALGDFSKAPAEIGSEEWKLASTKFAHKRLKRGMARVPLLPLMWLNKLPTKAVLVV